MDSLPPQAFIPPTPQFDFLGWKRTMEEAQVASAEHVRDLMAQQAQHSAELLALHVAIAVLARQLPDARKAAAEYLELMQPDEKSDPKASARLQPAFETVHTLLLQEMNRRIERARGAPPG